MTVECHDDGDRIHVLTPGYEWTILKRFDHRSGRGPCYISDIRERRAPHRRVLSEATSSKHTVNDPELGGLFGVGVVAAYPDPVDLEQGDAESFWRWGWELTTRLDAGPTKGFGVTRARLAHSLTAGGVAVHAAARLRALGALCLDVSWAYLFGPGDRVTCKTTLVPIGRGLWIKEPKIVANGWHGARLLDVYDDQGARIGDGHDLFALHDPARHTLQISGARRRFYCLVGDFRVAVISFDRGLRAWTKAADAAEPMSTRNTPPYCLDAVGSLRDRLEVTRRGDSVDGIVGLLDHGWEGGYGAPDCWAAFRPWPRKVASVVGSAEIL